MAFIKKTWLPRIVDFPGRRKLNTTGVSNEYDVVRAEGNVSQSGDGFTASNMNDLENRIGNEFSSLNSALANIQILTSTGTVTATNNLSINSSTITIPFKCIGVCSLQTTIAYNIEKRRTCSIQRNSVTVKSNDFLPVIGPLNNNYTLSHVMTLNAGDVINARTYQDSGSSLAVTTLLNVLLIPAN